MTKLFESATCTRCGGSGKFSFCQQYGSTCFKCHGAGDVLTKRGRVAQEFLTASYHKPVAEIKVGDLIQVDAMTIGGGFYKYFAKVSEVSKPLDNGSITITTDHEREGKHSSTGGREVRFGQSAEEKTEKREAALEYQANLTKAGTPRKRKAA